MLQDVVIFYNLIKNANFEDDFSGFKIIEKKKTMDKTLNKDGNEELVEEEEEDEESELYNELNRMYPDENEWPIV